MRRILFLFLLLAAVSCGIEKIEPTNGSSDFNKNWKFIICEGSANLETPTKVFEEADSLEVPYGCAVPLSEDGPSLLAQSEGPSDSPELAGKNYNDSKWRRLDLPHDWAVEGDFNRNNPSGTGGGALPGGIGWYRKDFFAPKSLEGKCVSIEFDGVYMNSTIWINGHELGTRPYGYISFSHELTPYLEYGKKNTIAVRVDNSDQPNSRWYSGCGIFRPVRIMICEKAHIAHWGIFARCLEKDLLSISARLEGCKDGSYELRSELIDRDGEVLAFTQSTVGCAGDTTVEQTMPVNGACLWSLTNPYLYDLRTALICDGKEIDVRHTNVGFRELIFDSEKGVFLNGEHIKINGVCLHHDLGALGSAVNRAALKRELTIMKEMGVNSIRCSHNPPSLELLDLCDEMGLLVMDEAFDMWRQRKTERDYARFFEEWHARDLTDLIVRDRNHPSVIMYSIGNEVLEQWSSASADTLSLEEANFILNFGHGADQLASEKEMSVNSMLTRKLADMVRELDPTRPVVSGCNEPDPNNHLFRSGALDIIGYNYHDAWFADVPENFPGKPFLVSESVSSLMTRGYYKGPSEEEKICPPLWDDPHAEPSFTCSSYDNFRVPWGSTNEHTLKLVEENAFIGGQYIWTGFDYIGEPIPYGWPARSSYFGLVDLAGFPKDVYYMYQSVWRKDIDVLHIFPHWNWNEGDTVEVWAYYNNADSVELFLNGESLGKKSKEDRYHCRWEVPFAPGELKAVSYKDGKTVLEKSVRTAGVPASLRLTADRASMAADSYDMTFVTVEVIDSEGNLCPWADEDIKFEVKGAAEIAGVDNGSPITLERFKANHRKAFYGKCLVMLRNTGKSGKITLAATSSDGSLSGSVTLNAAKK